MYLDPNYSDIIVCSSSHEDMMYFTIMVTIKHGETSRSSRWLRWNTMF